MKPSLKQRMLNGESVVGTWCMLPSPVVVDVIARTGADFLVIDLEHGAITGETADAMVTAAFLQGCQPIVRVGDADENTILRALETDCKAILVPHIASRTAAERVVRASRYAPLGNRGLSPYTRCHGYTHEDLADSLLRHAEDTLVGVLVEGQEGIHNLKDIAAVPGLDLIYLGMYDISQSVGLPGDLEHPVVIDQLTKCLRLITDAGLLAGTFVRDIETAKKCREMGFSFIAYVADSYALSTFYKQQFEKINSRNSH